MYAGKSTDHVPLCYITFRVKIFFFFSFAGAVPCLGLCLLCLRCHLLNFEIFQLTDSLSVQKVAPSIVMTFQPAWLFTSIVMTFQPGGSLHVLSCILLWPAVIVEVNSETDFVARSQAFQDMVYHVSAAALLVPPHHGSRIDGMPGMTELRISEVGPPLNPRQPLRFSSCIYCSKQSDARSDI